MITVNSFFDSVVLVNLARRPDRLFTSDTTLKAYDISYQRYEAIDGLDNKDEAMAMKLLPGEYGCKSTHLAILKLAKQQEWSSVLILEDDIQFRPNFLEQFDAFAKQVPDDWAILYLSGNHGICAADGRQPYLVRKNIMRTTHSLTTAAWACHNLAYDLVIYTLQKSTKQIDLALCEVQRQVKSYAFYPSLITQMDGFSDIQDQFVSYGGVIT